MKILYIQDSLGTGGAEKSNAELWYYLHKRNYNLKILVLERRPEGIEKEIVAKGFDVTFLTGNFFQQVWIIRKIIIKFQPDLVHSVLLKASFRVRLSKMFTSFIHIESLVNCSYAPIRFKDPRVNKLGLKFSQVINRKTQSWGTDKFIAITNEVKQHAIEYIAIPKEKISVILRGRRENPYLGYENKLKIRKELELELGISPSEIIFVHVGRQEYQKAHLLLLKAIQKVTEELHMKEVTFIFCGRKGNASNEIEDFLKENKITVKLHWLGHRMDVSKILAGSDAFVFPSYYEGLGGALIEAQAAGLPIICSDIPVFHEVVCKNANALMCEVANSEDLSQKILHLANSENLRKAMGEKSIHNYRRKFQIEKIHEEMNTFYKNLIG